MRATLSVVQLCQLSVVSCQLSVVQLSQLWVILVNVIGSRMTCFSLIADETLQRLAILEDHGY